MLLCKLLTRIRSFHRLFGNTRFIASKSSLIDMAVDDEGIATVTMQRLPVNSLNTALLQELSQILDEVTKNNYKGMVLTSASPTVFSAGLDIMEFYKADHSKVTIFWNQLQEVWLKLYGSNYPTAAAINGYAPAGGCLLAMSCEYRIMVSGKFTIGPNETALGIVAPRWFMDTIQNTIAFRESEIALTTGKLFTVDEALKIGLIDKVTTDKDEAIAKSKLFIKRFDKVSREARSKIKLQLREGALRWLTDNRQFDTAAYVELLLSPQVQQGLELYLNKLKNKTAK